MPNEMNHAEVAEKLDELYLQRQFTALRQASEDETRIANRELVESIHETPRKIKPTDPKALFEKQCPRCDSLLFATDNFCGNCGALMDGKDDI